MSSPALPRVLFVDDEPRIVEALALILRKDFEVHTALSGEEALGKLRELNGAAVVVSDMRMPGMDGATLLQKVRESFPHAVRILLTGEAGRNVAVLAVNKGHIFRYLTKPCPPEELRTAVEAGVSQHRLLNAEKAILQETLLGLIAALIDVLAITNPVAFGRARRVTRLAMGFAKSLGYEEYWQLEASAMLSQIGYISLPMELAEKVYYGHTLTPAEALLAQDVTKVGEQLLDHVPRLDPVMQVLAALGWEDAALARLGEGTIGLAARILGLTLEFDTYVLRGRTSDEALEMLRVRGPRYGADNIDKFAHLVSTSTEARQVREMPLKSVLPGMTILQDVRTQVGTLLVPRGFEVTERFLERIVNFNAELLDEMVRVAVQRPH